ncbi:hypothetical protein HMPREF0083_01152 [Aneurinibacillus aneurinilyticus ATCC 12856]|uniref:Uncharacterized protein n=1 Tax=Aneurinibacillus aneurinilyticus ATCC 12856 TaxID=649747 RepID=U1WQ50_ANEAE|nr:hypothetical protein HMPREF0083_01152 [Aneurinibacillus aneurinilyticus ATCC 12856]
MKSLEKRYAGLFSAGAQGASILFFFRISCFQPPELLLLRQVISI